MLAAKSHSVTVVNRGTYSMAGHGVVQVTGDRQEESTWRQCREHYDAVVDFCAYEPGDIAFVLRHLAGSVSQYIFISTADVYRHGTGLVKDEEFPLESQRFPGKEGDYIAGKVALEGELQKECTARGIHFTSLRPVFLYGPYNYAPREPLYIRMAAKEQTLPFFSDADGRFQMVYVKDAAEAALRCLGNPAAYGQAYNLCPEESATYEDFFQALCGASQRAITRIPTTAREAMESGEFPLPFPVYGSETELYTGKKGQTELGISYLSLSEGMKKTYLAFEGVL